MNQTWLKVLLLAPAILLMGADVSRDGLAGEVRRTSPVVLDMADGNPGEPPITSAFCNPTRLSDWGYTGQIVNSEVEGIATFDAIAPGVIPESSVQRAWADAHTQIIAAQIRKAHLAGVKLYAWMQVLVLPQAVAEKFKDEIGDAHGRIDIHRPRTQELFRAQLDEIFDRLPDLDGLVIRTGEIYLQALPYHVSGLSTKRGMIQGSTIILHGPQSHIDLLNILRQQVCVQRNKTVVYRTWDFGNHFHVNPVYYLAVTNAIEPQPNLLFSIKEQAGDFQQLTPFNPTIGIGRHRQIIEVQCQREAYGKGAYPYYIGQGAIDGFEESAWMAKPGDPRGLRDVMGKPQVAGIWTWSRGGGWHGPYISSELWCELNAFVVAKFAEDPSRTETDIFNEFARQHLKLTAEDAEKFRALCLLSTKAVLRGQLTTTGAAIDLWWARDDTLSAPDLSDFIKKGLTEKALDEKHQAVAMWKQMEDLSRQIRFADPATSEFVITSCTYGRLKYSIIEQGWTIELLGKTGDATGSYDRPRMVAAIAAYDHLWAVWNQLKAAHPSCSTLSNDRAFEDKPGMGAMVDHCRDWRNQPDATPISLKHRNSQIIP